MPAPRNTGRVLTWLYWPVVMALVIWRCRETLAAPHLYAEDGPIMFGRYYCDDSWTRLFDSFQGYVSVVANFGGYLCCRLPVEWIPTAFVLLPLCFAAFVLGAIALPAFRAWLPDDRLRRLLGLSMAAIPFGNVRVNTLTINLQWSCLPLLALICCLPEPRDRRARWAMAGVGLVLSWAHAATAITAPICLWRMWRGAGTGKPERLVPGAILLGVITHHLFGVTVGQGQAFVFVRGLVEGPLFLLRRVVGELLLWPGVHLELAELGRLWQLDLMVLVLLALTAWAAWRGRELRPAPGSFAILGLAFLALAMSGVSAAGRDGLLTSDAFPRFHYIPRFCLLIAVGLSWLPLCRLPRQRSLFLAAVGLLVLLGIRHQSVMYEPRYDIEDEPRRVAQLMTELRVEEQRLGSRQGVSGFLDRRFYPWGDWDAEQVGAALGMLRQGRARLVDGEVGEPRLVEMFGRLEADPVLAWKVARRANLEGEAAAQDLLGRVDRMILVLANDMAIDFSIRIDCGR